MTVLLNIRLVELSLQQHMVFTRNPYELEMCSYFDFSHICDINEFKSKLFKCYEDERQLKTRSLTKLRTYVTFKQIV